MRYEDRGEGSTPIVLIHEMGGSLETWDFLVDTLAAVRHVIRFDKRGCGLSEWQREPMDIDMLADDVSELLDHLGISGKAIVIGCAVGGAVAIHFAARHPGRVAGLVAMSPAVGVPEERKAGTLARADYLLVEGVRPTLDERLANSYPQVLRTEPQRYAEIRSRRLAAGVPGMSALTQLVATMDLGADYANIHCPTQIIAGIYDGDRPPSVVKPVADRISGARYVELASGHFMPMQTPELVLDTIMPFIGSCTV
jgi:pimeloyl-ACP methyl ester carboxylesterase